MKGPCRKTGRPKYSDSSSSDSRNSAGASAPSEAVPSSSKPLKYSGWSGFLVSANSIFEIISESKSFTRKTLSTRNHGWTEAVKRAMYSGSMRRILGLNRATVSTSKSDIWLLGIRYRVAEEDSSTDPSQTEGYAAFFKDFSSKILITYRKGFTAIGDSKYTSDVNWGCMLRSSQMLVAQALLFDRLGRSWRRSLEKLLEQEYVEILQLFADSADSAFSIHNLLEAGKAYGLAPGSWVGPYAICRTWETLAHKKRDENENGELSWTMAIHVVSGDEDGERGGAPVLCIEDISRHCLKSATKEADWKPLLLLVPLVLGLDKINPRYIPLLGATFTFPQSLGILGGRPGASTYIVGLQDEKAFYLDPHEVQLVVDIRKDDLTADTSSYHCNVVRHFPIDSIDPSLAIGFYCRDKSDFDDFSSRAIELAEQSNGAPLFTVAKTRSTLRSASQHDMLADDAGFDNHDSFDIMPTGESGDDGREDDWQLL